jgi:hypothetical protein
MSVDFLPTFLPVFGFFTILCCVSSCMTRNTYLRIHALTTRVEHLEEQNRMQQITTSPHVVVPQIQPHLPPPSLPPSLPPSRQPPTYPFHQGVMIQSPGQITTYQMMAPTNLPLNLPLTNPPMASAPNPTQAGTQIRKLV